MKMNQNNPPLPSPPRELTTNSIYNSSSLPFTSSGPFDLFTQINTSPTGSGLSFNLPPIQFDKKTIDKGMYLPPLLTNKQQESLKNLFFKKEEKDGNNL